MNKILILKTSIMKEENSISNTLLNTYLEKYKKLNPNDEFIFLDLNNDTVGTEMLTSNNFNDFFKSNTIDKNIDLLKNVNKLIITAPMYNFNIPVTLKNYIDHIAVANKTFSYKYSKKGDAIGFLTNLKVQILAVQGAPSTWYNWANLVNYLEGVWKFLGANINPSILLAGTKSNPLIQESNKDIVNSIEKMINKSVKTF